MSGQLGDFEFTILAAVAQLGDEAYGAAIHRLILEKLGRNAAVGAIYLTLRRLSDKKLLTSRVSDPTPVRGGRARRHYRLTASGAASLRRAARERSRVLESLSLGYTS